MVGRGLHPGLLLAEEQSWMNNPYLLRITLPPLAAVVIRPAEAPEELVVPEPETEALAELGASGGNDATGTETS